MTRQTTSGEHKHVQSVGGRRIVVAPTDRQPDLQRRTSLANGENVSPRSRHVRVSFSFSCCARMAFGCRQGVCWDSVTVAVVCVSIRLLPHSLGIDMPMKELIFWLYVYHSLLDVDGYRGKKSACVGSSGATLVAIRFSMETVEVCWVRSRLIADLLVYGPRRRSEGGVRNALFILGQFGH